MKENQKIIEGPQSVINIFSDNNGKKFVRKMATERGNQDILDQIEFYLNIPTTSQQYFPNVCNYQNIKKPYILEYEYIEGITLRQLVIEMPQDDFMAKKISNTINEIHENIHTIEHSTPDEEYIDRLFFNRIDARVTEVIDMLSGKEWIIEDFVYKGQSVRNPVKRMQSILKSRRDLLVPEYLCTTHGQLGPSHIIYDSEEMENFHLIDAKGFSQLHDPLYDICKLMKGIAYGTEYLEENLFEITYSIRNDKLIVENFKIENFVEKETREWFSEIVEACLITADYGKNSEYRLYSLVAADIMSSLPFGFKAGGEKRVVALCIILSWIAEDLEKVRQSHDRL